jgi:hypothetical protein
MNLMTNSYGTPGPLITMFLKLNELLYALESCRSSTYSGEFYSAPQDYLAVTMLWYYILRMDTNVGIVTGLVCHACNSEITSSTDVTTFTEYVWIQ